VSTVLLIVQFILVAVLCGLLIHLRRQTLQITKIHAQIDRALQWSPAAEFPAEWRMLCDDGPRNVCSRHLFELDAHYVDRLCRGQAVPLEPVLEGTLCEDCVIEAEHAAMKSIRRTA
jgi:hypothetical protein